ALTSVPSVAQYAFPVSFLYCHAAHRDLHSFPTRRSSDLDRPARHAPHSPIGERAGSASPTAGSPARPAPGLHPCSPRSTPDRTRSEEHTSELQSRENLVCRLLLEKKKRQDKASNSQIASN